LRFPPLVEKPGFWQGIDLMKTPTTNSWISMLIPAERFNPVEVRLDDNTITQAIWTGAKWWSGDGEVAPRAWRPISAQQSKVAV
jgi:hypothetical protein